MKTRADDRTEEDGRHRLGGFRLLDAADPVGAGGQGTVRRAVCEAAVFPGLAVGTTVALKVMPGSDSDDVRWRRLESKVSVLAALDSPDVVRYHGCFRERVGVVTLHVVVMEFLEGETLRMRLERSPGGLDADVALDVARAVASGLAAAAAAGLVHRDVKPDNIFLCADGKAKVIDFGIARHEDLPTATGSQLAGSFDYMAPERTEPDFRGDERSDVFSLGVVLHEALFGCLPYAAQAARSEFAFFERWSRQSRTAALALDGRAGRLLPGLDELLKRALAVDREDRFSGFAAFASALGRLAPHEIRSERETYRVLSLIGEGGFGEVFRARRLGDGAIVAVKHLKRMDGGAAERFRGEARAMAALDDSAFVRFHEYFESGHAAAPQAYLVMDYLDGMPGRTLRDAMRAANGRGLPHGEVIAAFARYAHGLAVLHTNGIVHRDIKPSNLYYPSDAVVRSAIMDLGVALDWKTTLTVGSVSGTLEYMPPEVIMGESRGSPSSDVYALGLCLYEALTGRPAFPRFKRNSADAIEAFVIRARQMRAPEFDAPLVGANPELERLLRRMTEPDVARRMSSAAEAELELQDLLDAVGRGDWHVPQEEPSADCSGDCDAPTSDAATQTTQADAPLTATGADVSSVPLWRRIVRNRRELMLILALIIELLSTAVIIWQRPRPVALEVERRQLAERLKAAEEARATAERAAAEATAEALRIKAERDVGKGR